jgi:uncharacterized repeat protein (TIGR04052 family)
MLAVSCAPERQAVEIAFELQFNGQPISCAKPVRGVRLTDFRFYVHELRLLGSEGQEFSVQLAPDGIWQNDKVVLIDLESGEGACVNGSAETNRVIRGSYVGADVEGIAFAVGVPQEMNHADPMQAGAPLNYTEMHWHWASGYKFLRAGVESDADGFFLHLGSSRCEGTIGAIKGCKSANRPVVRLREFKAGTHSVVIDLGELVAGVELEDDERSDCQSGPTDNECRDPFTRLGIDFDSGESTGAAAVFKTGRLE